jgi:hypothetical protein
MSSTSPPEPAGHENPAPPEPSLSRKDAGSEVPAPNAKKKPDQDAGKPPSPVDLSSESVAGEEDPGAGLDTADDGLPRPAPPGERS